MASSRTPFDVLTQTQSLPPLVEPLRRPDEVEVENVSELLGLPVPRFIPGGESLLLALPAEIRLQIYDMLAGSRRIVLRSRAPCNFCWQLCQTNSQIRREMLHYYASNFHVYLDRIRCRDDPTIGTRRPRDVFKAWGVTFFSNITKFALGQVKVTVVAYAQDRVRYGSWAELHDLYWNTSRPHRTRPDLRNGNDLQVIRLESWPQGEQLTGVNRLLAAMPRLQQLTIELRFKQWNAKDRSELLSTYLDLLPRLPGVAFRLVRSNFRPQPGVCLVDYILARLGARFMGIDPDKMYLEPVRWDVRECRTSQQRSDDIFDSGRTVLFGDG